jgi:hypothetical protein
VEGERPPQWPVISEPELLERLRMDDRSFREFVVELLEAMPQRDFEPASYERALGYPWERPGGSFVLDDGRVELVEEMADEKRRRTLEELMPRSGERAALLAIGSNAAPEVLERKFAHFAERRDRRVLALSGRLHDFDVGIAAQPALYGSLPATLFPSPGTAVAATVLSVTPAQFTQLAWTEISYALGRLTTRFEPDRGEPLEQVFAFVSRFGAFRVDGRTVALGAVPAEGRTAPALSQEEALAAAAALALGPEATAEMLVRAVFEETIEIAERIASTLHLEAEPFRSDRWTPFAT